MPEPTHTIFTNIQDTISEIKPDSILSRTIFSNDRLKVIMFGFAEGQELSEHTSSKQAILHFIEGEARLVLGKDEYDAGPGTWVRMDPNLPHSVFAQSRVTMLLIMLE